MTLLHGGGEWIRMLCSRRRHPHSGTVAMWPCSAKFDLNATNQVRGSPAPPPFISDSSVATRRAAASAAGPPERPPPAPVAAACCRAGATASTSSRNRTAGAAARAAAKTPATPDVHESQQPHQRRREDGCDARLASITAAASVAALRSSNVGADRYQIQTSVHAFIQYALAPHHCRSSAVDFV